tara:strand:+ start:6501 stop:7022 length:522 start_codon:yes stop_codon:yes gene_type:complete
MTNISNKGFWLWGAFSKKETENLKYANRILNSILIGPSFHPHLTLYGPIKSLDNVDKKNIEKICSEIKKFELKIKNLEIGTNKYQSIYLVPEYGNKLLDLRANLIKKIKPITKQSEYIPHISLYYGDKTYTEKKKALLETNLTLKKITFKSVCYVYVDEEKDLWEIIESFDLS